MKNLFTKILFLMFFTIGLAPTMYATHIVGLEMSFQCLDPATRQYRFTVSYSEVCPSSLTGMSQTLTFESITGGCATFTALATQVGPGVDQRQQICATQITNCSGGTFASVMRYTLQVDVVLPAGCNWRVSTGNCCRATAITNLQSPDLYGNYIESTIDQNTTICNNSPTFASQPVLYACAGQASSYNHGTIDVDGDSLAYQLVDPRDYISPYPNVPFIAGLSATNPLLLAPATSFVFNSQTGQMNFTPQAGTNQRAIVVVRVFEYRNGVLIGTYIRELQITVSSTCTNNNPAVSPVTSLSGGSLGGTTFSTCPGNTLEFTITATDLDVGQILTAVNNIAANLPGSSVLITGNNPMTLDVSWPVPLSPLPFYTFTVVFSDDACPIQGQQILGFAIDIGANVTINADSIFCPPGPEVKPMDAVANPGTFSWSPASGLSCTTCASPTATVAAPITYTVTYTDAATGCSAIASHTFGEHLMNLTSTPAGPIQWCSGDAGVSILAELNGDPGTVIVPNPNRYDISSVPFGAVGGGGYTSITLSDDQLSAALPIGFNFTFYGISYSSLFASSNGFLSFDAAAGSGCCSGQLLPNTTAPNNLIAFAWDDLYPPGGGTIRYKTLGTAPNRQFVIQYSNIPHYSSGNPITAQVILNETTNCVEIHTQVMPSDGSSHTMGLENAGGTFATPFPGRNSVSWSIAASEAWQWCPGDDTIGTGITYLWSPAGGVSNVNAQNPTITPTSEPMSYTVTADDGICNTQLSIPFSCILLGADCKNFAATFDNNKINLLWSTQREEQVQGFAIERSTDAIFFEQVGFVNSKGNSNQGHHYDFIDNQNIHPGQIYYYRLMQHELNGTASQICDALSVATGDNVISSVSVRPNPIREQVEVVLHSNTKGEIDFLVYDVLGHSVCTKNMNTLEQGINTYKIQLTDLPAGVYYLRIGNQKLGYSTQRLVKVNP